MRTCIVTALELDAVFGSLSRVPDVAAENLLAYDATDRLLLETAAGMLEDGSELVVVGDRYGALTLGALAGLGVGHVRVHQDLATGRLALERNAAATGLEGRFTQHGLDSDLLANAGLILVQLPKSLAELEEIADAVARFAAKDAVVLAGGRVKHMSVGMNAVLENYFSSVQPQLARQKSRVLIARDPKDAQDTPPFPVVEPLPELGITVCAHGAVFSGARLDIGTRFLLAYLEMMPSARRVVDLGCGTGILATMYALRHEEANVLATDQSAAAVASARATADANGVGERVAVLHDDAMSTLGPGSADLILLNPPFHVGASVHAGAALKMFEAASRILAPGGELWTVYNSHLQYRGQLERMIGPTSEVGRNPKFTVTRSLKS
ncbi:class I SAM-dependent methyltransferase [Paenarthrobacter nicotinovorans]|uniref:class I SAM-dependent methyltransferase n=1 Tax=Paenarthrobacter nicotinovorans TaxID=29320 RepID=UPI0004AD6D87|nr:methyltransferase [Paenarthrobacter nicotinovorans]